MSVSPPRGGGGGARRRGAWLGVLALLGGLLVARNLIGLDSTPSSAYVDETSIGYNAWAISTHAVDEHGAHLPLYFTAFGEYKNPVYIYTLSAVLRVLSLSAATERLPAALFGMFTCMLVTLIAWRRSRSLPLTAFILALSALTPWLTVESRVGFEVIAMVATVSAALGCLCVAQDRGGLRWHAGAGVFLAVSVFAYSTGRVAVALFVVALAMAEWRRGVAWLRRWVVALVPVGAAYALLAWWSAQHPGAITARFNAISIAADGAPAATVMGRFVGNYLTYFGPAFLFSSGDQNPRHNTQFAGMLLWVTLPLLLAGVVALWRRRSQPFVRFVALGLLLAPVSAALTSESVPHALRAAVSLPFLLVVAVEGAALATDALRLLLARGGAAVATARVVAGAGIAALAVQGTWFTVDLFGAWPARSAVAFDWGELDAIHRAVAMSHGATVLLSDALDQPYIQAAFLEQPDPPRSFGGDSETPLLSAMNMQLVNPDDLRSRPGAIAVLGSFDAAPPGAQVLYTEVTPPVGPATGGPSLQYATVIVYRLP